MLGQLTRRIGMSTRRTRVDEGSGNVVSPVSDNDGTNNDEAPPLPAAAEDAPPSPLRQVNPVGAAAGPAVAAAAVANAVPPADPAIAAEAASDEEEHVPLPPEAPPLPAEAPPLPAAVNPAGAAAARPAADAAPPAPPALAAEASSDEEERPPLPAEEEVFGPNGANILGIAARIRDAARERQDAAARAFGINNGGQANQNVFYANEGREDGVLFDWNCVISHEPPENPCTFNGIVQQVYDLGALNNYIEHNTGFHRQNEFDVEEVYGVVCPVTRQIIPRNQVRSLIVPLPVTDPRLALIRAERERLGMPIQ